MTISDDSLREKILEASEGAKGGGKSLTVAINLDTLMSLIEAHTAEQTRELENIKFIMTADIRGVYIDPLTGKKLYNESAKAEAVREAEERRKIMFPEDYEDLFVAIERWSREGRTEEQVHGATNFITSRHFPKSHLTQSTKESEDGWKKGTLYKS